MYVIYYIPSSFLGVMVGVETEKNNLWLNHNQIAIYVWNYGIILKLYN